MNTTELITQSTHELLLTRCDRCPATAQNIAHLPSGRTLQLCGHHAAKHIPALFILGARVRAIYASAGLTL